MNRSTALQPLSHDHHQGLAFAARLRQAHRAGESAAAWAEAIGAFWREHLVPHFAEEEELVLPVLQGAATPVAQQLIREHEAIKAHVTALGETPVSWEDGLLVFADLLTAHIRFEEREAFPAAEGLATAETLARIRHALEREDTAP